MSVIVNTNVPSIKIQNCLTSATNDVNKAMERLSTGFKINSAKDDAAGCVISEKMQVQLDGNKICQQNVQTASSMLSTAEGNIDSVEENMSRIRSLVLEAKNGSYSDEEIAAMDKEVQERIKEINRVSNSAEYSDTKLFNDTDIQKNGVKIQVGQNSGDDNVITADKSIFAKVTFSSLTGLAGTFSLSSTTATDATLDALDDAIDDLTDRKALIGASQNRLESALNTLTTGYTNLSASKSLITDADVAEEASNYTSASILQQISTSMLAQANQAPAIATSLI